MNFPLAFHSEMRSLVPPFPPPDRDMVRRKSSKPLGRPCRTYLPDRKRRSTSLIPTAGWS